MPDKIPPKADSETKPLAPPPAPLAYSINGFSAASGLGRSKIYEEIKAGRLPAKKCGSRTIIAGEDARAYIAALPDISEGTWAYGEELKRRKRGQEAA